MRKLFLVVLIVIILIPLSVAALGNTTNVTVEGNIYAPAFSIDVSKESSPAGWGLAYGDNSWFTAPGTGTLPVLQGVPDGLTITAHAQKDVAFSVSVSDKLDWGKPLATKGKMAEYRTGAITGWVASGKVLTNPVRLNETLAGGVTFKEYVLTTDSVLFTGKGDTTVEGGVSVLQAGTSRNYDVRQLITLTDNPVVSPVGYTHVYKLPITFTLTTL